MFRQYLPIQKPVPLPHLTSNDRRDSTVRDRVSPSPTENAKLPFTNISTDLLHPWSKKMEIVPETLSISECHSLFILEEHSNLEITADLVFYLKRFSKI